jgi:hypothetical protein
VSVSVHSVTEGQITQPQAVITGQVLAEKNAPLLFGDDGHCSALSPVKERDYAFLTKLVFCGQPFPKIFSLNISTA